MGGWGRGESGENWRRRLERAGLGSFHDLAAINRMTDEAWILILRKRQEDSKSPEASLVNIASPRSRRTTCGDLL